MHNLTARPLDILRDAWKLYVAILRVMVPTMIVVKLAETVGAVDVLGVLFAPMMSLVGLPPEMGLVFAATALLGMFSGFGAFATLLAATPLTVAQASILGSMTLIAHALPLEQRICQRAGAGLVVTTLLRLGGALAYGMILNALFTTLGVYQDPAVSLLPPTSNGTGWLSWARGSAVTLAWMFAILLAIVGLMRVLDALGVTRLLRRLLAPVLRLMGMGETAAPLTVIGILLGITCGSSLILRETEAGTLSRRDVFLSVAFLCLCHSVIDDTLFVMALGGDWLPLLVGRFLFAVAAVSLLGRLLALVPEHHFERFLMARAAPAAA